MLKKELNRLEVSLDTPYKQQVIALEKGQYVLRLIHQNDAIFKRLRSLFFSFAIDGKSPEEVKGILGLRDISDQFGAFAYVGAGSEESGYFVKELILNVMQEVAVLNIDLRTFLPTENIFIEAFQVFNAEIPLEEIYGEGTNGLFFKAEEIINFAPKVEKTINVIETSKDYSGISLKEIDKVSLKSFNVNPDTPKKIILNDLDAGHYVLKITHQSQEIFEKHKSLFFTFSLPDVDNDNEVKDILGLSSISSQHGVFSYVGGGVLKDGKYYQDILLEISKPVAELRIELVSSLSFLTEINQLEFLKKDIVHMAGAEKDKSLSVKPALIKVSTAVRKYPQYWVSDFKIKDAFFFQEANTLRGEGYQKLDKKGTNYTLPVNNDDETFVIRFQLEAQQYIDVEKQAILTIDYQDANGESLPSALDAPYGSQFKKYYHYLSVNPSLYNNLLLYPPVGTKSIELGVRLWDAVTDINFNGLIQTVSYNKGISVVIPSYKGEKTIIRCLDSLYLQSLDASMFEVIIALNGERDATRDKINKYLEECPSLNVRALELDLTGASYARNQAIKQAKFSHITFVDDDDYINEDYLFNLWDQAQYDNIGLTGVVDIVDGTNVYKESLITNQLLKASQKDTLTYNDVTSVLTMNACKIAPTYMVKSVLYNENLKSGEDVVYWSKLLTKFQPNIHLTENFGSAVYYRVITDNSVSRQQESYDFNVSQRLKVISDLILLLDGTKQQDIFIQSKISAQSGFIKRFLIKNESLYSQFQNEVIALNLQNNFINEINSHFTDRLVISYCFAPYADTSAVVMSKRINKMKKPVDVISNSMSNVRSRDESLNQIASFNIGRHIELKAPQSFSNWDAIVKFSEMIVQEVGRIISKRGVYKEIYSRAMWPASHFAAALIKV